MAIVMLVGAISHWWNENWNTPEHWKYALWRDRVCTELVNSYFLVYRPHEAFKGPWDDRAQSINDFVLRTCDVVVNLTPEGVPSVGTDNEILYAQNFNKTIVDAPPPEKMEDFERAAIELNQELTGLMLSRDSVEQRPVIASIDTEGWGPSPGRVYPVSEWDLGG